MYRVFDFKPFIFLCLLLLNKVLGSMKCVEDGYFRHPEDCSVFVTCSNGKGSLTSCPEGLLYSLENQYCDWPEVVDCKIDIDKLTSRKLEEDVLLYLTFDDGPSKETETILNVLKEHGVQGTFFINSKHLFDPKLPTHQLKKIIGRMTREGHVIADHSYDHMFHNSLGVQNAYVNVVKDEDYFGKRNILPVLELIDEEFVEFTNFTMYHYIRQPYSNNWRIPSVKENQKPITSDCISCTTPRKSGQSAIELADDFYKSGRVVVGWDTEWGMNFDTNQYKYGGLQMFTRLKSIRPKRNGQIVILTHDRGFTGNAKELSRFVELAKRAGYTFRTIENYVFDEV